MQSLFRRLSGFFIPNKASEVSLEDHAASESESTKGCRSMTEKHYNEAIVFYNKAIELDPNDPFPYYSKALAYEALGRYQEALIAADKALKRDPASAIAHNTKGMALFALGRYREALAEVDMAISFDHTHHEPQNLRDRILAKLQGGKG